MEFQRAADPQGSPPFSFGGSMAWNFGRQPDPDPADPEKEKKLAEQSKAEADAFIAQLTTSFATKLTERLKPLQDEIAAVKTAAAPKREEVRTDPPQTPSVLDDEDAAFNARIGPLAVQTALLNARMTETEVLNDISSKGWGHLIPQIREVLEKQTPLQTKAGQGYRGYVENVASMLIGKEATAKGLKFDGNKQTFFLEDGASSGNNGTSKDRQLNELANDGKIDILKGRSVAEWAKVMGISNPESLLEGGN
jgi:hypothetical protein